MVVSPKRGKSVIEEAVKLEIMNIWLQPGTYDDELNGEYRGIGFDGGAGVRVG